MNFKDYYNQDKHVTPLSQNDLIVVEKLLPALPPGAYLITDPTYVMSDEMWQNIMQKYFGISSPKICSVKIAETDIPIIMWKAKSGKASYPVMKNRTQKIGTASSDSGMLAIVPEQTLRVLNQGEAIGVNIQTTKSAVPRFMNGDVGIDEFNTI